MSKFRMSLGHTPGPSRAAIPPGEEQIREELERVLSSHEFRSSKRRQEFLRYVVEHTLSGRGEMLKERTIGIDVFGRPAAYDPGEDATVRVKAGEVRKRLGLYYSTEGARNPIRIELPSGTYVPEFHPQLAPTPIPIAPPGVPSRRARLPWGYIAGALGSLTVAGLFWVAPWKPVSALDQFWGPLLAGSQPAFVCAAFVPVWGLDRDAEATGPVGVRDFVALSDQFVGGGDLIATSRLTSMLTRMKHPYRLKVGNDVTFADLRSGSAILVGYSYTRWKEISSQLRYSIEVSPSFVGITDNGRHTEWVIAHLPRDRRTTEDYAVVTRVFHTDTHATLVEVAGITQYGTDGASDLVTNSDLMNEEFARASRGWQGKNLQLVVHVKVIGGAPSSPQVVARYFW
jgi:hypothetical protein